MLTNPGADAPEPPPVLVRAFLDASQDALAFLAGQPGFRSAVTVEQASENGIVAADPAAVTGPFWVRRTFSTSRLTGVVTYGERELEINLLVGLVRPLRSTVGPYALWEWAAALDVPILAADESIVSWCSTESRVRAAVAALGAAFKETAPRIAAAGRDVAVRIEAARAQRRAAEQAKHAQWKHDTASARAAEAFRAGDYRKVVSLLAPLEGSLSPAEQKKLVLARKRL
jgi:hypothetical protein